MSVVVPLPEELRTFIARPAPETMIVRGLPGTGKTSLALTLLDGFAGQKIYVTSRVPSTKLAHDFPWLGAGGNARITVVDASRPGQITDTAHALEKIRELVAEAQGSPDTQALWVPPALQEAWSMAQPDRPAMVVVDSWDAIVEKYLGVPRSKGDVLPDRAEIERLVLDQLSRGPVHTVLVLEREGSSQLDYLVNGVVSTERILVDGRPERWLHLHKLRGVRLDNASYPFTLESARFRCIDPFRREFEPQFRLPEPEPSRVPGYIWPGSSDFATHLGRLPLGQISLFETETGVPDVAVRLVVGTVAVHVVQSGGRVFTVLPPQTSPKLLREIYRKAISDEEFRERVRMQTPDGTLTEDPDLRGVMMPLPRAANEGGHARTPEAVRFLREGAKSGGANLTVVWIPGLNTMSAVTRVPYYPETLPAIALEYTVGTNAHEIFIGMTGDPLLESIRSLASTQFRFRARNGRVLLYGTQPVTPSFVLTQGNGSTNYRLLEVV